MILYYVSMSYVPFFLCDYSTKALNSTEEVFDVDFLSWFVTSASAQSMSAVTGEPKKHSLQA